MILFLLRLNGTFLQFYIPLSLDTVLNPGNTIQIKKVLGVKLYSSFPSTKAKGTKVAYVWEDKSSQMHLILKRMNFRLQQGSEEPPEHQTKGMWRNDRNNNRGV